MAKEAERSDRTRPQGRGESWRARGQVQATSKKSRVDSRSDRVRRRSRVPSLDSHGAWPTKSAFAAFAIASGSRCRLISTTTSAWRKRRAEITVSKAVRAYFTYIFSQQFTYFGPANERCATYRRFPADFASFRKLRVYDA